MRTLLAAEKASPILIALTSEGIAFSSIRRRHFRAAQVAYACKKRGFERAAAIKDQVGVNSKTRLSFRV